MLHNHKTGNGCKVYVNGKKGNAVFNTMYCNELTSFKTLLDLSAAFGCKRRARYSIRQPVAG